MTSAMTETGVCNMALDMLHEGPIGSIDDDEPNARRFKRNFEALRDSFLATHPWNFAIARTELAASADAPFFGWDYSYPLPDDCLRVLPLREEGLFNGGTIAHEIENGNILTDAAPPIKCRYIKRVTQLGLWSPVATTAFAAFLAANLAHAITGKASFAQLAADRFEQELKRGQRIDGLQGMTERADTNDVIAVRG
ncbi:hypothetical protein K1W69_25025 [Hoeflea sp. WL0058]|uniref:Uncharacterized protein n=1 Tax=Flavimaribacter sediminis TaxID=2865987 RepID=A0AAE3D339_9HYPH|nr:hypothetical protein [Flavimaribacter sediminis]MBW8640479.1 hypothetical protein [Flavimaribacter sediminis]